MVSSDWPLESRTVQTLLERGAERWPERLAMRDDRTSLTYAELLDAASAHGAALADIGVAWQEPVAFMLDNTLDHALLWLGATYHGRIQVQVNTAYRAGFLSHVLNVARAETIVIEERFAPTLLAVLDDLPHLRQVIVRGDPGALRGTRLTVRDLDTIIADARPRPPERRLRVSDVYGILYTSGTTGLSKGVVQPHGLPFSYVLPEHWPLVEHDDVVGVFLPQFHIAGQWTGHLVALMVGASSAIIERFSVTAFWDQVTDFAITQTTLMATMTSFLWKQPPGAADAETPLRRVLMAPITDYVAGFEARFGVSVCTALGQTESSCPIIHPYGGTTPGCVGWLRADFDGRVVGPDGLDVAPGEIGELLTRPHDPFSTMLEYKDAPEATVEKWQGLWMHHGDMVRQDEQGQFFFVDRRSDAIRRRGENISSLELEGAIMALDGVAAVAVVGVADPDGEQEVMAWVQCGSDAAPAPEAIHAAMVDRLPAFMVPRYIEIVDELPRTPTAKVMKNVIREAGVRAGTWDARARSDAAAGDGRRP